MPEAAAARDVQPLAMIGAMTECAFELGVAASEIAKGAGDDTARFLAATAEFRHCFFAVRMGIRLTMAQGLMPGAVRAAAPAEPERAEADEPPERPDWNDRRERVETEREREGDYEPVSLPQFLKTLGLAAASAEARRDGLSADIRDTPLPRLQGLLRQAKADPKGAGPSAGAAVLARPPASPAGRSRLLASTGAIGVLPKISMTPRRRDSG